MPADQTPVVAPLQPAQKHGFLHVALDFGPLLAFFIAFKMSGVILGTAVFMVAIVIAVVISKWRFGKVSPMLWLSAVLVLFFGSLTIYFRDQRFIQLKPTIIYGFFAVMLLGGYLRGRPLLKYLLQAAYDGLSDEGWKKLSRNWGLFFVVLALANELMRAFLDFDLWLQVKLWGVTAATFIFAAANVPMLLRHGLLLDGRNVAQAADAGEPPQG